MPLETPEHGSPDRGQVRLTYAELAERLGITGENARILVRRRNWLRIVPNMRGQPTVVVVPEDDLAAEQMRRPGAVSVGDTASRKRRSELEAVLGVLERTSSRLAEATARAELAEQRADNATRQTEGLRADLEAARAAGQEAMGELQSQLAEADATAVSLRTELADARAAVARVQAAADEARAAAQQAQDVADRLRGEEEARQAQSRLRRVWQAWRGN
jgi:septal ring factor EnvC (AmiA/AmiB activator)